jgi:hypothetical protein
MAAAISLAALGAHAASPWGDARTVTRAQIVAALREQQALGYRVDAIANSVRLQAGIFLSLADKAIAQGNRERALRLRHQDWYAAYLEATGLKPDAAPTWVQVPYRFHEDYLVEFGIDSVLDAATTKDLPRRALRVTAGWASGSGAPASYSFEDHSIDPAIETTRAQVNGYAVLDYGGTIVIDAFHGVTGRATSGLLGAVFSVVGHARAVQTRFAVAADGTQVSRTSAHKGLTLTQAVAISPDGRVQATLPQRADLLELNERLRRMEIRVSWRRAQRLPPLDE